ncbi:hypothetical protein Daura_29245 [Dactylosporangium aurantiacum]|uniref:Uncharacterized protein n=1 Tax=Dactylosporangium aurantiacum TaxID=35754 RepID=A0A9Q9IBD4_9ACTN|nr:hypothetical protein [Dactylosporangium aurantiacum]MDG6106739.1 hypothetical protein [Dactylosporangium aurantiacum]UWZ50887.1 hypothetical protein Daura_29245 [Dactylosporangium aurantiacum]
MADDARSTPAVWRILIILGVVGNAAGLIAGVPVLTLVGGPLAIVGVVGLLVARRKAQAAAEAAAARSRTRRRAAS